MSIESAEATVALAERLQESLDEAHLSASEIADQLGITEQTVNAWLRGRAAPRAPHLMVWARICGVPFERLMGTLVAEAGADVAPPS